MALLLGLHLCYAFRIQKCVVECDSSVLVNLFNGQGIIPWRMKVAFKKISRYKNMVIMAKHCFREANMVADRLTAVGQEDKTSRLYKSSEQIPKTVRTYIMYDAMRMCNIRLK